MNCSTALGANKVFLAVVTEYALTGRQAGYIRTEYALSDRRLAVLERLLCV